MSRELNERLLGVDNLLLLLEQRHCLDEGFDGKTFPSETRRCLTILGNDRQGCHMESKPFHAIVIAIPFVFLFISFSFPFFHILFHLVLGARGPFFHQHK